MTPSRTTKLPAQNIGSFDREESPAEADGGDWQSIDWREGDHESVDGVDQSDGESVIETCHDECEGEDHWDNEGWVAKGGRMNKKRHKRSPTEMAATPALMYKYRPGVTQGRMAVTAGKYMRE